MKLKKILNKKLYFRYSLVLSVFVFLIIVLRLFFPFTREVAIFIFIVSSIFSVLSFKIEYVNKNKKIKNKIKKILFTHKIKLLIFFLLTLGFFILTTYFRIFSSDFSEIDETELRSSIDEDSIIISANIKNLNIIFNQISEFDLADENLRKNSVKKQISDLAFAYLDLQRELDIYKYKYQYYYKISFFKYPTENLKAFILFYVTQSTSHNYGIKIIRKVNSNPKLGVFFNEKSNEYGIDDGGYNDFRNSILNSENTIISNTNYIHAKLNNKKILSLNNSIITELYFTSNKNLNELHKKTTNRFSLYIDYFMDIYEENNIKLWTPIQKGVANGMGNTRIVHRDRNLISLEQSKNLISVLEPGDILLGRKNWYMSNVGIPGFWPHAMLYVGSFEEINKYFENQTVMLDNKMFGDYIKDEYPKIYLNYIKISDEGYKHRVLEAISLGVVFNPIEVSSNNDYFVAFRPILSKEDKLKAILNSFSHFNKPYDYEFDFTTDSALVCSELVFKAYLGDNNKTGLNFQTSITMGREILSPTDIANSYGENKDTPYEELEFVIFYDGNEELGFAKEKNESEFMKTLNRSKWSFSQE